MVWCPEAVCGVCEGLTGFVSEFLGPKTKITLQVWYTSRLIHTYICMHTKRLKRDLVLESLA